MLLGGYLFVAPWIMGSSGDKASSVNAWIVSACTIAATLRVPVVSGPRAAELIRAGLGIRRTLLGQTSGVEIGMCVLGYRACLDGGITLNHLIDKELPGSEPLRRLRLEMLRRQAARSLARTREVIPPGVSHAWHRAHP